MSEIDINRRNDEIIIQLKSTVSAVLVPLRSCPPLPVIEQKQSVSSENPKIEVRVSLFALWKVDLKSYDLFYIRFTAPGFKVIDSEGENIKTFTIPP